MKHHLEEVHDMTEAAIKECENFIAQLKVQREQREQEAKQYISSLLDQGRQVLVKIEAGEQAQKQAQQQAQALAELKLRQEQRAQQQAPASADASAQPAAAAGPGAPAAAAAAASGSAAASPVSAPAAPAAAGPEAQPIKQEQQDAEMADASLPAPTGTGQQLQQQQSQTMDAAPAADQLQEPKDSQNAPAQASTTGPIAMGPPAVRPARVSWQHQKQAGAAVKEDTQKQQPPAQQSDTAAGTDVGVAAALPFPGGWALAQWTAQPSPAPGPAAVRVQVCWVICRSLACCWRIIYAVLCQEFVSSGLTKLFIAVGARDWQVTVLRSQQHMDGHVNA